MKKIWISAVMVAGILGSAGVMYFSSGAKAVAMPVVAEDIQYPFVKGGGLVNVAIENVFMGVGMLTGERKKDEVRVPLIGSINFELASRKAQARLQVDQIRLVERAAPGKDARVFEPVSIHDRAMEKKRESALQFPKEKGKLPFVWENGKSDPVYFVFENIPSDLEQADLVITYNGKFPHKKHIAYYEDRLPVKRKSYQRN